MKEWTEIYEQMRGTFAQRAGFVPSEGCDSAVRLYALAAELQSLLMQADWVLDQSFPQTAQGMYLDYHAETRGITRAPAVETVAVTAALKAAPGYTFAEAKAGAQSALEALFTGELLGKSVTTARLLTLLCGVEGVENVHLTAPAADVAVGSTELPMLGTVTISELTEA